MEHQTDGILLVDKHGGETSYEVVKMVRYAFGGLKVQKVGHAGTLDPFATGLLIVLLGQGTKLSPFLMTEKKVYLATMRLGVETDTLDPTGRVVRTSPVPYLTYEQIHEKSRGFVGEIEQVPPIYSAVKHEGKRAYKLARKGLEVGLKKRTVIVYSIEILSVHLPDVKMMVTCSRGTYIRSLAADLGMTLGPGSHLISLRRLSSGAFEVQNALSSKEVSRNENRSFLLDKVIPLRAALPDMCEIQVAGLLAKKIRNGYQPTLEELNNGIIASNFADGYVKLVSDNELVAITKTKESGGFGHGKLKIERVFS
jgi:tRNA pseudouridine55 synthase